MVFVSGYSFILYYCDDGGCNHGCLLVFNIIECFYFFLINYLTGLFGFCFFRVGFSRLLRKMVFDFETNTSLFF